jgi:hypothetical protein
MGTNLEKKWPVVMFRLEKQWQYKNLLYRHASQQKRTRKDPCQTYLLSHHLPRFQNPGPPTALPKFYLVVKADAALAGVPPVRQLPHRCPEEAGGVPGVQATNTHQNDSKLVTVQFLFSVISSGQIYFPLFVDQRLSYALDHQRTTLTLISF